MVNFNNNVTMVIDTLKRYRYGPRAIQVSMDCYNALNESMALNGIPWFSMDYALEWCENSVAKYPKSQYQNAVYRLYDVYEYGRILGSHLVVYAHPSEQFQDSIEEYLSDISLAGSYTQAHLTNIRHKVVQFCCFMEYNGAGCIEDIDYSMLDDYDRFLRESSKACYINEGLVSGFLEHMSARERCRMGYSLYIHYIESDKCTSLSDLAVDARATIHGRRKAGACFPAEESHQSVHDFTRRLKSAGYSRTVTDSAPYHLTLLICPWTGKTLDMTVQSPMCGLKQSENVSLEKAYAWQDVHMRCMMIMSARETSCPLIGGNIRILNTTSCRHGAGLG